MESLVSAGDSEWNASRKDETRQSTRDTLTENLSPNAGKQCAPATNGSFVTPEKISKTRFATKTSPINLLKDRQAHVDGASREVDPEVAKRIERDGRVSLTPKPNTATPKQRRTYRASCAALGMDTEEDHATQNGDAEDFESIKLDLEAEAMDVDEFAPVPLEDALENAERIFGVTMPPPLPTFRQRMNANKSDGRFVVTSLVLENFKSYAGRIAIGPFHRSFTCIIGPNGSGKSNTIDALLFVFGYKPKRLRASKVSELIHKSARYPDCKMCRVTVHFARIIFDANDLYSHQVVSGSEYSIAREAYKEGDKSLYYIDGVRRQREEVVMRLRNDGIDIDHNRFLILQGEVEQIAMMKPKGKTEKDEEMLEYIEDIVGTNQYIDPIKVMNQKVEDLAEEEERQNVEVFQFSKTLTSLEQVKKETEDFLLTENEVFHRQHLLQQIRHSEVMADHEQAVGAVKECDKHFKVAEEAYLRVEVELKTVSDEHKILEKMIRELESGPSVSGTKVKNADTAKEKLHTKLAALEDNVVRLEKEREKFQQELEKLHGAPERLESDIRRLDVEINESKNVLEEARTQLQAALEELPQHLTELNNKQQELEGKLNKIRPERDEKLKTLDDKKVEEDGFTAQYDRAVKRQQELTEEIAALEHRIAEVSGEFDIVTQQLPAIKENVAARKSGIQQAQRSLSEVTDSLNQKRDSLQEARARTETASNDKMLERILQAQDQGQLAGIVGRLGELATIDEKYDAAISTNYTGPLNHIVVGDKDQGKQLLEYLKYQNLGRASICALEQIAAKQGNTANAPFRAPAGSQRLFDLIQVADPAYRAVFYYFLGNTLVADDIDTAARIAYGKDKFRVITLDGKVVDGKSGSMTGGGDILRGRIRTSAQGQLVRDAYNGPKLEHLQTECEALEARQGQLRRDIERAEAELLELEPGVRNREEGLRTMQNRLKIDDAELKRCKESLEKQQTVVKKLTPDPLIQADFQRALEKLQTDFDKVDGAFKQVEDQIKSTNTEIARITEHKVKPLRKKQDDAKSALEKLEKQKQDKQNKIHSHGRDKERAEQNLRKRDEDLEKKTAEIETLGEELKGAVAAAEAAQKEREADKELLDQKKNEYQKSNVQVDVLDKKLEAEKTAMEKFKVARDKAAADQKALLKEAHKIQSNMDAIKLHEVQSDDRRAKLALEKLNETAIKELADRDFEEEIGQLKFRMSSLKPDLTKLKEYYDIDTKRKQLMDRVEEVRKRRKLGFSFYMALKNRRFTEFNTALRIIKNIVKTTYRQLTLGGDASLEPIDRFDPFSEGLEFMVKPKTKSWKNIGYLSGGEKTISSLALIFALHYFKPTPFYIMDEIDAALDFRNTSVIAFFVKERAVSAQFIIVSLRNQMFETAYRLIGICKPDNHSMSMYIDPQKHVYSEEDERRNTGSIFSQGTQGGPRPTGGTTFSQHTVLGPRNSNV
ncbi:structural maintenance of chromosomes protein 4-like [Paramacrobiotus metropolitanus]|uniref:structural maintenance of chromosomes protein 4-like n=1 Tax=Paramacrobiotus metropolitanus TaxID=2943436 RepID=UPI002445675F|nr:structural maintenance of chromosomes protein 4-like [Paramacrobiotus metropolitanus]XP_055342509.1 structural maintenance of chromosomes protein 4-like [Paramacrobiotus metropolitanus]XP_055342519.1 structural maintenance of chromosomes protein 4-like [Paramacrobiotus metropolitanus]XP_055342529.1 structural maintenance of chromosomes protein 4-like [Paramacrobiotus metropolitanus]